MLLLALSSAGCFHNVTLGPDPTGAAGAQGQGDGAVSATGDANAVLPPPTGAAGFEGTGDGAISPLIDANAFPTSDALAASPDAKPDADLDPRPHKRIAIAGGAGTRPVGGNLGGLAGADAQCQESADINRLGGTWIAWLSDSKTDAIDRVTSDGPWYTLASSGGTLETTGGPPQLAFAHKADLTGTPRVTIVYDQDGYLRFAPSYWTGTRTGGTKDVANCKDWTSSSKTDEGSWGTGDKTAEWTAAGTDQCWNGGVLLCLEL
jgi:hypothetical protein